MIAGIFHDGSGLGNQLHRYVMTRVLAADKGLDFGMINAEGFKGTSFMKLDMGKEVPGFFQVEPMSGRVFPSGHGMAIFSEKAVIAENGLDIRGYDPEVNFVEDNTIIDGEFQDEKYFGHRLFDINKWLEVEHLGMPEDVCIIGFRGGEFTQFPDLFLPQDYWRQAMDRMLAHNYHMKFICVTDDPTTARAVLPPEVKIMHEIGLDWRRVRHAANLIIANSSFYILPALLNRRAREIIAPRGWARHNLKNGTWALPQNFYRKFHYL